MFGKLFPEPVRLGCNGLPAITNAGIRAELAGFVLNAPLSSAICRLTARWRLGDFTRAMMIKSILTICAALTAGAAGPRSRWRRAIRSPRGVYTPAPQPLSARWLSGRLSPRRPGVARFRFAGRRRGAERAEFDGAVATRSGAFAGRSALWPPDGRAGLFRSQRADRSGAVARRPALWPSDGRTPLYSDRNAPTGPILSPDDPRYGHAADPQPAYSDRGAPTGPVLSPNDPRYGRPDGPPPVIYSDRNGRPAR